MIQIYSMLWISAIFFAIVGVIRGWNRELVTLAGIILSLFALFQFDALLRGVLLASVPNNQVFFVELFLFGLILYATYRTRGVDTRGRRNRIQDGITGGLMGALNGYLIWSAVWYFLDINEYPLDPLLLAPAPTSISAQNINSIPLVLLGGAAGSSTELLTVMVIVLFLFVLFMM